MILGLTLLGFSLRPFVHQSVLNWLAPFRIVFFSLIIAYGITTRKIMEVSVFLRRSIAYVLLTVYLLALYGAVWGLASYAAPKIFEEGARTAAHIFAAIIVAFAMAPARGISQILADRLFGGARHLDFRTTMNKANAILRSVSTLDELLKKFAATIAEAVNTDRVVFVLPSRTGYDQNYPAREGRDGSDAIHFEFNDTIVTWLTNHESIVLDELHRSRLTPELEQVAARMENLGMPIAMAVSSREHLAGDHAPGPAPFRTKLRQRGAKRVAGLMRTARGGDRKRAALHRGAECEAL